jgi:hypothetical protein
VLAGHICCLHICTGVTVVSDKEGVSLTITLIKIPSNSLHEIERKLVQFQHARKYLAAWLWDDGFQAYLTSLSMKGNQEEMFEVLPWQLYWYWDIEPLKNKTEGQILAVVHRSKAFSELHVGDDADIVDFYTGLSILRGKVHQKTVLPAGNWFCQAACTEGDQCAGPTSINDLSLMYEEEVTPETLISVIGLKITKTFQDLDRHPDDVFTFKPLP